MVVCVHVFGYMLQRNVNTKPFIIGVKKSKADFSSIKKVGYFDCFSGLIIEFGVSHFFAFECVSFLLSKKLRPS